MQVLAPIRVSNKNESFGNPPPVSTWPEDLSNAGSHLLDPDPRDTNGRPSGSQAVTDPGHKA